MAYDVYFEFLDSVYCWIMLMNGCQMVVQYRRLMTRESQACLIAQNSYISNGYIN